MMNLTRMYQSPEDYMPPLSTEVLEDHEEMELLLEAYLQVRLLRCPTSNPLCAPFSRHSLLLLLPKRTSHRFFFFFFSPHA